MKQIHLSENNMAKRLDGSYDFYNVDIKYVL